MLCPIARWLLVPVALGAMCLFTNPCHAATERPNILFIIYDDWGWQHAGAYGCQWVKTPNFDRVAREGILFQNCFTSNPKCSPCRASILTGRNTWQLEEACCHHGLFPSKFAVYPDLLEQAGYTVGLTGKGWGPGDFTSTGFKRNPAGPSFDKHKLEPPTQAMGKLDYARNFQAFLDVRPKDKPFCFWIGFAEPHRPYTLDTGRTIGRRLEDVVVPAYLPDTEIVRSDLLDYALEVEYGDAQIGKALEALEAAGELDRTLVVITSDHGMPFPFVKGQIHEDGFHLPLAMRWPSAIKPGRVVADFINVRDFAPTYLELAGLKPHAQMSGHSLRAILIGEGSGTIEPDRNVMLVGKERHDLGRPHDWGYPVRAIRTTDFLYVHNYFPHRWPACDPETDFGNCDPSPSKQLLKRLGGYYFDLSFGKRPADELYRLTDDPQCVKNLAADPFYAPKAEALKAQMLATLREEQDPRVLGNGSVFDTYYYTGSRRKAYDTWLAEVTSKLTAADLTPPKSEEPAKPAKPAKKAKRQEDSAASTAAP
ncbi:MAG TPA: sulfatase [Pirellulales bacterium]|jgi:arylsulfatase A-like enzyme|nr:sulfatase [Pirellulales bacterium]